ncbi:unnamed protein product [Linum tenue]|uniref:protein-serine/threonine phosphatase n=1 Tax=Linum tenue TaxID=586396 RepID=A0AAV0N253_9ROSI|nr:unnamed protein product [Linum tenue]
MALFGPQHLERFVLTKQLGYCCTASSGGGSFSIPTSNVSTVFGGRHHQSTKTLHCPAIAIDAPNSSSLADVAGVRWGFTSLQGAREEMEDDIVIRSDDGFSFAAVFDGHAGFNSVKFLRDELFKECVVALQGGSLLGGKDFGAIRAALEGAFQNTDSRLLSWLETNYGEDESGSTATVVFIASDMLIISHIGDSTVVLSRSGKAEVLTDPHRPYGNNKTSLQEIRRIREAGGWKGVQEGRWTEKFTSRIQFNGDLVVASPDTYQVSLGSDAEFVVLASDGLWDYMNSSDAVQFVRDRLKHHGNVQLACEELASAALDRRSQDNISIIIADLGKTDWQSIPPLQQQNFVFELGQAFATLGIVSLGIWMSSSLFSL